LQNRELKRLIDAKESKKRKSRGLQRLPKSRDEPTETRTWISSQRTIKKSSLDYHLKTLKKYKIMLKKLQTC
jgi:hypothetical protein